MSGAIIFCRNQGTCLSQADTRKLSAWCLLFDLLRNSPSLSQSAETGSLAFGFNTRVANEANGRHRRYTCIVRRHSCSSPPQVTDAPDFHTMASTTGWSLTGRERAASSRYARFKLSAEGVPWLFLEVKTCMHSHLQSLSRLSDELASDYQECRRFPRPTLCIGLVLIGNSGSVANNNGASTERVAEMVRGVARGKTYGVGRFDRLAPLMIDDSFGASDLGLAKVSDYEQFVQECAGLIESQ